MYFKNIFSLDLSKNIFKKKLNKISRGIWKRTTLHPSPSVPHARALLNKYGPVPRRSIAGNWTP